MSTPKLISFTIGARDYDVPVPMTLLALKHAWPFIDGMPAAKNGIETAELICGVVAAGMMLDPHPPGMRELMATLTADQFPALHAKFAELMDNCGLEMSKPGEAKAAGTAAQIGTESSPSSPPTDSKAAASEVSQAA